MPDATVPLGSRETLSERLLRDLNRRVLRGEWQPGDRLPSEAELAASYDVSRVTVRTALQALEVRGLVRIRHGAGSFVQQRGLGIRASLQQLQSISETIRELGHEPAVVLRSTAQRAATEEECERLDLPSAGEVLELERAFLADDEPVAYSKDRIPVQRVSQSLRSELGQGSLFRAFTDHGVVPSRAVASVHAVHEPDLDWPCGGPASALFVVLDQLHEDRAGAPLMLSRSYFVEGRFQFRILRTR